MVTNLHFPDDLSSEQYGHYMVIGIWTSTNPNYSIGTGAVGNILNYVSPYTDVVNSLLSQIPGAGELPTGSTVNKSVGSVALFIPGSGQSAGMIYNHQHEYADIRLSNLAGGMLGGSAGGIGGIAASAVGRPVNPGVEVLYRTTKLRTFNFSFLMAPQTASESEKLKSIIKMLRANAAPDAGNGIFFKTPSEFSIDFYNKGMPNLNIPKIGRCVLENITVDYAPQGEWSTFRNGHPVSVLMNLDFQEMEIMTSQKVQDGY